MAKVVLSVVLATLSALVAVVPAQARSPRDRTAPTAPSNLNANAGDQKVDLAWGASSDNFAVKGYRVYRNQTLVGSVPATTRFYTDAPLTNGVSETYTVKAYDRAGNLSATSNPATATPVASRDTSAPTSPTGLTAKAGDASVQLAWTKATDNAGVTAYRVFRGGIQVASVNASTLSYTDTGLMNGTTYSYTAVAVDAAGNVSSPSNTVTATPTGPVAPSPPSATCASQSFCGDLETGNYSQYGEHEWSEGPWADQSTYTTSNVGHSEADIVTSPVKQGTYASRCTVRPTTGTSASDRCEPVGDYLDITQGTGHDNTQFYGWWTYFPGPSQDWWCGSTCSSGTFNDFTQFGQYPNGLPSANWLYMGVDATHAQPRLYAQYQDEQTGVPPLPYTVLSDPLQYDHWYHFIVEARWSFDPSVGYISIWVDGVNVVPKRFGKTLSGTATQVHVGQGLYRAAYSSTNTVVHDGLCRATTFADASAC